MTPLLVDLASWWIQAGLLLGAGLVLPALVGLTFLVRALLAADEDAAVLGAQRQHVAAINSISSGAHHEHSDHLRQPVQRSRSRSPNVLRVDHGATVRTHPRAQARRRDRAELRHAQEHGSGLDRP